MTVKPHAKYTKQSDPDLPSPRKPIKLPLATKGIMCQEIFTRSVPQQAFSRTLFVFFSTFCELECNTTADWLNRMV